jgi:hypothetical protein
MKSRLIVGDHAGARADAVWALDEGAASSESAIGRYAAALAQLVIGEDDEAGTLARTLAGESAIPPAVTGSLVALASHDGPAYEAAIRSLVADFEARDAFLEDIPVADTVLAVQELAAVRGVDVALTSSVLPS